MKDENLDKIYDSMIFNVRFQIMYRQNDTYKILLRIYRVDDFILQINRKGK